MRNAILTIAALSLTAAGCKVGEVRQVGQEPREAITYAARAKYPGNPTTMPAMPDVQTAAVDYRGNKQIEILNLTNRSIPASTVWVNGTYLKQIDTIPPKGSATLRYDQLLEAGAGSQDLKASGQAASKVELQTSSGLIPVQGPSVKD